MSNEVIVDVCVKDVENWLSDFRTGPPQRRRTKAICNIRKLRSKLPSLKWKLSNTKKWQLPLFETILFSKRFLNGTPLRRSRSLSRVFTFRVFTFSVGRFVFARLVGRLSCRQITFRKVIFEIFTETLSVSKPTDQKVHSAVHCAVHRAVGRLVGNGRIFVKFRQSSRRHQR